MDFFQVVFLAVIQGLTEFLPISSSAHLALVPVFTDWRDQGLVFDVAVHTGSLLAVITYLRHKIAEILSDGFKSMITFQLNPTSKIFFAVGFATIPVGLAGVIFNDFIEANMRSPILIAIASIGFGVVLYFSDYIGRKNRDEYSINWLDVLLIGLAQTLALIPGTSRSGATMTAGLFIGLNRQAAARFSFLLSIPVIALSGIYKSFKLVIGSIEVDIFFLLSSVLLSAIVSYFCIHYFLKLLDKVGMLPFVIYRIILGLVLLYFFA